MLKQSHLLKIIFCLCALGLANPVTGIFESPSEDVVAAYNAGHYKKALGLLLPLANQGDATAQFTLGEMYAGG